MGVFPVLLIRPDGAIERLAAADPFDLAASDDVLGTKTTTVATVHYPDLLVPVHVLIVDDFGIPKGLPVNRTAWMLYGGSPIYGSALFFRDDHQPLSDRAERLTLTGPDEAMRATMDAWLLEHHADVD